MASLVERYADRIVGVLSCYDRVVIKGTIGGFTYAAGMASFLSQRGVQNLRLRALLHALPRGDPTQRRATRQQPRPRDPIHSPPPPTQGADRRAHPHARLFCPPIESLGLTYQWNIAQVEYATDIVFRRRADLTPIYDSLVRTAHARAPLEKSIYSLHDLRQLAVAVEVVRRVGGDVEHHGRSNRGFNFFSDEDVRLFEIILRGEHTIQGLRNSHIRQHLSDKNPSQISRLLRRLRSHGLIKKIGRTYKYYVTATGRSVITTGLELENLVLIPEMARVLAA